MGVSTTGGNSNLLVIVGVISNILSVVGVVICNKYIIEVDKFKYSVFLSFLHFAFTAFGTRVLLCANYFTHNTAPMSGILPVAIGSLLSVAFMNMNLAYNSVGFYQLSKLACIPITLLIQYLMYNQTVSTWVQLTLVPITFGVGYATIYDVSLNTFGLVIALFAVVATAMAQIFTNTYQKTLDCNALQLLYHTSPYIALVCFLCGFFLFRFLLFGFLSSFLRCREC
jgi:Zn-dependent protease with chaperone function